MREIIATIIVGLIVLGFVLLAVRSMIKKKKTGGCCGSCAGCSSACTAQKKEDTK